MTSANEAKWTEGDVVSTFGQDILESTAEEIEHRVRLIENEIRVFKNDKTRISNDEKNMKEKIKENTEKIKLNKQLPYLVANIVEVCSVVNI